MKNISKSDITAVILAGGQATRMNGQDKGLILFKGRPLIAYVADVIRQNVHSILVSANRNIDLYQDFGEVITDNLSGFQGPLAGISSALANIKTKYLLVLPCDGPFVDDSLINKLSACMEKSNTGLCVASEQGYLHPTFALIDVAIKPALDQYLQDGERKLGKFFQDNNAIEVDFSDYATMFVNLNSPEDFLINK